MAKRNTTKIERFCQQCNKQFFVRPSKFAESPRRFCSKECMAQVIGRDIRTCCFCNKQFSVSKSDSKNRPNAISCSMVCRKNYLASRNPNDYFWSKVEKTDGCWIWTGPFNTTARYGSMRFGSIKMLSHRYSWVLHNGTIPDGLVVCHKCDNPPCVNPEHLFLGTHHDNVHDKMKKNRAVNVIGSKIGCAVFVESEVFDIRVRAASGESVKSLAKEYEASETAVRQLVKGNTWKHVPMPT